MKKLLVLIILVTSFSSFSADLPALKKLFKENYNTIYQPRFCGRNTRAFVELAKENSIDLSNSYVLKIVGGGFLETSAFYSRTEPNERVMIGYFHMVLVADDHVFDFDLAEPLVLDTYDYFRLQFTPPYEPYKVFGIDFTGNKQPLNWSLTAFDKDDYAKGEETTLWAKKVNQHINIEELYNRERVR